MRFLKLLAWMFLIIFFLAGCGSDTRKKGRNADLFPNYGLKEGDIIILEISSPGISSGASGSTGTPYQKTMALDAGTTDQLSVVAQDILGNSYTDVKVTWVSDNPAVATVDNKGKVTGVAPGSATITGKLTMSDGTVIDDHVVVTVLLSPIENKSWLVSNVTLPQPMWDHASAIWKGYLYVGGGNSGCSGTSQNCGFTDQAYYTPIHADGTIESFSTTTSLPRTLRGHAMLAYNDYMYLIGGIVQPYFGTAPYPDPLSFETILNEKVYYAPINSDGSIGIWKETTPLPPPGIDVPPEKAGLFALSATIHNDYIYITGGWNVELKKNVRNVLVGQLDKGNGGIITWIHNDTSDLPYDLSKHTSVATTVNGDHYLYVIGGNSGAIGGPQTFHKEIYYAKITSDGIPYNWTRASSILPSPLIDHAAVASDRYIFISGGRDGDENSGYDISPYIYYYFVTDNGDLELLKRDPMPPLFHHTAVADKNTAGAINIYVTGGAGGDTQLQENRKDSVYYFTETNP